MSVDLRQGHVLDLLRDMPSASVHMVCTSPPYYGLRDYGLEPTVWGGDPDHAHTFAASISVDQAGTFSHRFCVCGAWRGALGLEPSPELYVDHMLEVFAEVRRVLRPDGTLWLSLGDSYAGSGKGPSNSVQAVASQIGRNPQQFMNGQAPTQWVSVPRGLKAKDLMLMPYRVVMALQAAGGWVRSQICWHKRACMPESVQDRPVSSWEPIFLLTRQARYYYDAEGVRDRVGEETRRNAEFRGVTVYKDHIADRISNHARRPDGVSSSGEPSLDGRNLRNVWSLGPEPFASAHFATFPTSIPDRCIRAGTSEHGCCAECGAPWRRTTSSRLVKSPAHGPGSQMRTDRENGQNVNGWAGMPRLRREVATTGWQPACKHDAEPVPCTVLDPFAGAGTTLMVADRLGRDGIGLELNPEYVAMAERRIAQDREERLLADRVERESRLGQVSMFGEVERKPSVPKVPRSDKQSDLGKRTYVGFNERWRERENAS